MENARAKIADCIGADSTEIYFTSCGTESDNWAIKGAAQSHQGKGRHMVTSAIEHHAVLHAFDALAKQGFEITKLPVDADGLLDPEAVRSAIRDDTILVSVMMANNEIGVIQPIEEIAAICRSNQVLFHTDAVQAGGALPIDAHRMGVDLMSFSGHKLYAPKGVGALYIRRGVRIANFFDGGAQERNRRGGTENVPAITGFARAFELAIQEMEENSRQLIELRDASDRRYSYAFHIPDLMVIQLDVCRTMSMFPLNSSKARPFCSCWISSVMNAQADRPAPRGALDPSHVLLALGLPHEIAHGSLRVTFGRSNTMDDVNRLIDDLEIVVRRLREMSPLYNENIFSVQTDPAAGQIVSKVRLNMQYSDRVMDHFMNPRNVGEIEDAEATGLIGNAKCGDIMKMFLKIEDGIIVDAKFKTFGCGAAIATSSMATEMIKGKTLDEALQLTNKAVAEALGGLPPVKMHCSLLAEQAVKSALKEYYEKHDLINDDNRHLLTSSMRMPMTMPNHADPDGFFLG